MSERRRGLQWGLWTAKPKSMQPDIRKAFKAICVEFQNVKNERVHQMDCCEVK